LVRCAKETFAVRKTDNAVWQSAATGTDQNDLAVAWRSPFTGGSAIISQSPTPVGRTLASDYLLSVLCEPLSVWCATLVAILKRTYAQLFVSVSTSFDICGLRLAPAPVTDRDGIAKFLRAAIMMMTTAQAIRMVRVVLSQIAYLMRCWTNPKANRKLRIIRPDQNGIYNVSVH